MKNTNKQKALIAGLALAFAGSAAQASHFRGAAMVPSVDANGLLTITTTSFWRNGAVNSVSPSVSGVGSAVTISTTDDTSDSRFTKRVDVSTIQLPGAGTYAISAGSCCRVEGIRNWGGGSSSTSWQMDSAINWNGSSASTPILFNFSAVQPEVVRGSNYSGNLGAVSGNGSTLTYDQTLNGIPAQPPGFTINTTTGALFIPAANTAGYADNASGNPGADYAFSGNIKASDGSSVEFDWLFDAVNTGSGNLAPTVTDAVINALVGDTINFTFTATDDGNPNPPGALTFTYLGFLGSPAIAPVYNPATNSFVWDTTGSAPGTFIAQVRASDGSLTDVGSLTINLSVGGTAVPEPGVLSLMGLGLAGLGALARRKTKRS